MTILFTLCSAIVGFFLAFGSMVLIHTPGKKTQLWGRRFPPIPKVDRARMAGSAGWLLLVLLLVFEAFYWADALSWFRLTMVDILIPLLGFIIGFLVAMLIIRPEPWMEEVISRAQNTLSLSDLPILQEADARIAEAKTILLNCDGIFFFDGQDYPFFTASFIDYKLGNLQEQDQLKLLGYYFRQKYPGEFRYSAKVDATYSQRLQVTTVAGMYTSVSSTGTPVASEVKQITLKRISK